MAIKDAGGTVKKTPAPAAGGKGKVGVKKKPAYKPPVVTTNQPTKKKPSVNKQSVVQKIKDKVNPVSPNKSGWMKEAVKKRTEVTPLPTKKK
jgi:hypothetical protein